jgi:hypothetical protein
VLACFGRAVPGAFATGGGMDARTVMAPLP